MISKYEEVSPTTRGGVLAIGMLGALLYTLFGGDQNTKSSTLSKKNKGSKKRKSKKCRASGRSSSKRRKRNHASTVHNVKAVPPPPPSRLDSRFGKIISNLVLNVNVDEPSNSDLDADKFADKASKTSKHKLVHPKADRRSSVPKWTLVNKNGPKSARRMQSHFLGAQSHSATKSRRAKVNSSHNTSGTQTTVRSKD